MSDLGREKQCNMSRKYVGGAQAREGKSAKLGGQNQGNTCKDCMKTIPIQWLPLRPTIRRLK
jgi:hypothetical protein